jgi:hypothetical protein
VLTGAGPVEITVPRDRDSSLEPVIVAKRQRRLSWRANWLRSADLAAAAAAGHAALEVARRPVAAIIPTGMRSSRSGRRSGRATSPTATLSCLLAGQGGRRPAPGQRRSARRPGHAGRRGRAGRAHPRHRAGHRGLKCRAQRSHGRRSRPGRRYGRGGVAARPCQTAPGASWGAGHDCPCDRGPWLPARCRGDLRAVRRPPARCAPGRAAAGSGVAAVQLACDWTSSLDVEVWVPVSLSSAPADPDAGCAPWRHRAGEALGASADSCVPMPGGRLPSAGKIRTRRAHRRPADTRCTRVTGQRPAGQPWSASG